MQHLIHCDIAEQRRKDDRRREAEGLPAGFGLLFRRGSLNRERRNRFRPESGLSDRIGNLLRRELRRGFERQAVRREIHVDIGGARQLFHGALHGRRA